MIDQQVLKLYKNVNIVSDRSGSAQAFQKRKVIKS